MLMLGFDKRCMGGKERKLRIATKLDLKPSALGLGSTKYQVPSWDLEECNLTKPCEIRLSLLLESCRPSQYTSQ